MEAIWQGKITVTATYIPPLKKNTMKTILFDSHNNWDYYGYADVNKIYTNNDKYMMNLTKVIFESTKISHEDAQEVIDLSEQQDNSVTGYYVIGDDEKYTLYIQADGKIILNNVSSYLGTLYLINEPVIGITYGDFTIEGINNLDTSSVSDMSNTFEGYAGKTLDVSNFNTANVTDMYAMFRFCNSLTNLDLSNFDTSKVTNMNFMFEGCSNLTTAINITNPNIEDYYSMFYGAATAEGAQITVNYTTETSDLVDKMIATKSENSNVVKGSLIS